jgi:hypothetical protein
MDVILDRKVAELAHSDHTPDLLSFSNRASFSIDTRKASETFSQLYHSIVGSLDQKIQPLLNSHLTEKHYKRPYSLQNHLNKCT